MADENDNSCDKFDAEVKGGEIKMFTLKKWNAVAMYEKKTFLQKVNNLIVFLNISGGAGMLNVIPVLFVVFK